MVDSEKIDGQTLMGAREATNAEHAGHVAAGYYVARLKGGHKLHLRRNSEDAACGAAPTHGGGWKLRRRDGWETYKQESDKRATCEKCLSKAIPKDESLDSVLARCITPDTPAEACAAAAQAAAKGDA